MRSCHGDWEMRVYELPDHEFVYSFIKDSPAEEDFDDTGSTYVHCFGLAQVVDGMVKIRKNGKYGFCDRYGNAAVPCVYDYAGQFESGLCIVGIAGKYGLVDRLGKVVVPLIHASLVIWHDDIAADRVFALPGKYLLDVAGAAEEPGVPRYPYTNEGPRCLLEFDTLTDYRPEPFWKESDKLLVGHTGRYGIIDNRGRVHAPLVYDKIQRNGVAFRGGRRYPLDADGRVVLPDGYDRLRKVWLDKRIAGDNLGDFILAGNKGEADSVFTKNGLLLCHMPRTKYTGRDVLARILEACCAGRLDENHRLIRAEGKYGVIQTGGRNGFKQDWQFRRGFAEILPFIWEEPEACAAEYRKMVEEAKCLKEAKADEGPPACAESGFELLARPFVRTSQGVQNMETGEIVLPKAYCRIIPSWNMNTESYQGFTANKDGRWHFVELIRHESGRLKA